VARHQGIVVRVLSWNLFHGRDHPPVAPGYVDIRTPLRAEFAQVVAELDWDVALLQEAPLRWFRDLARASTASGVAVPTSRNQLAPLRGFAADRWPDLIKSGEGGSNQILVRSGWRIAEHRHLTLARLPERRRMLWTRLERSGDGLCAANLHAGAHNPPRAAREVDRASRRAIEWSRGRPLVFGGDFNVQPVAEPWLFERLERAYGFSGPTGPKLIDHLLVRRLEIHEPPHQLSPEIHELARPDGVRVRLSDHAPVAARFELVE
jgi:endonuclease/exonuclease/phosphatase family metal-dependent hydrolase